MRCWICIRFIRRESHSRWPAQKTTLARWSRSATRRKRRRWHCDSVLIVLSMVGWALTPTASEVEAALIDVVNPRVRPKKTHEEITKNIEDIGLKRPITVRWLTDSSENYTHNLATAMLHATPAEQLVDRGKAKAQSGSSTETLRRLQREWAAVQADTKQIEDSYGPANLKLVIVKTHIKSLLENARVVRWLAKFRRDYLQQLQLIAEITELPAE
jgi:RepB plasmid partitioning protein